MLEMMVWVWIGFFVISWIAVLTITWKDSDMSDEMETAETPERYDVIVPLNDDWVQVICRSCLDVFKRKPLPFKPRNESSLLHCSGCGKSLELKAQEGVE